MANIEKRISSNKTIYRVKVRLKGLPTQTASFERLTDAKDWARETEVNLRSGQYFPNKEASRRTLAEAITRYIDNILPQKPKMIESQKPQLEWWKAEIGEYFISNVTSAIASAAKDKLAKGETLQGHIRSPSTVNRYLAALSHVFTIAIEEWGWARDNPLSRVSRFKEPRGRIRFLLDDEREALLAECQNSKTSVLYLIVIITLSTGARKNEILSLKWQDIDFNRKVITLHETKNNERRLLPLAGLAFKLLKKYESKTQAKRDDLVFPSPSNTLIPIDIRGSFNFAVDRANIKNFKFHDLRHCTASYLAMNGASLAEIAEVLGHKTLSMVKRYAHLSEAHTARVVASMNNKIFAKHNKVS